MTVVRASVLGVCSGVKRALEIAEALSTAGPGPVYSLGALVHNRQAVKRLEDLGVQKVSSVDHVDKGTVIIRAHGAPVQDIARLQSKGVQIVDATCPKVARSHRIVEEHSRGGYHVVIAGEHGHSEVVGLQSRSDSVDVVDSILEADSVDCSKPLTLLAQTTFDSALFAEICNRLRQRCGELLVHQTICPAMERRHVALDDLASRVDAILVIGGLNSANTTRMYERAVASGLPSWHIECEDDIPQKVYDFARVGIAAGASTPDFVVDAVEACLKKER